MANPGQLVCARVSKRFDVHGPVLAFSLLLGCASSSVDGTGFNGRWVMDASDGGVLAMEVNGGGDNRLAGSIVGAVGGRTQPFLEPQIVDGELRFDAERVFEPSGRVVRVSNRVRIEGSSLRGETIRDGETRTWIARPAAEIADEQAGPPGDPVDLFSSESLDGWNGSGWSVADGLLSNTDGADLLISNQAFWNFKLHVEYRAPQASNSGIGLRGRYEIQILGDHAEAPSIHGNGALYSQIRPTVNATLPPEDWQRFDITLVGARLSVVLNDQTLIDNQRIEGLTAIALDSDETTPGPITLQGDHGPIEFRKVVVTPLGP